MTIKEELANKLNINLERFEEDIRERDQRGGIGLRFYLDSYLAIVKHITKLEEDMTYVTDKVSTPVVQPAGESISSPVEERPEPTPVVVDGAKEDKVVSKGSI